MPRPFALVPAEPVRPSLPPAPAAFAAWRHAVARRLWAGAAAAGAALVLTALAVLLAGRPLGAQEPDGAPAPDGEAAPDFGDLLVGLLSPDGSEWLATLAVLLEDPAEARQVLLYGLEEQELASPNRWRIFHHLVEFGEAEDIPRLIEALEGATEPMERRALRGAMVALRPAPHPPVDLALAVEEFSFIQTRPARRFDAERDGHVALSQEVFEAYHLDGLPLAVTARLMPLKGRRYAGREALARAVRKQLGRRRWERYGKAVLAPLVPLPPRFEQEGRLRLGLTNVFQRAVLLEVTFDLWYGRFDPRPEPRLLYVTPGETARLDVPVRIVGALQGPPLRVDLRQREVQQPLVPLYQKFQLPRPEL